MLAVAFFSYTTLLLLIRSVQGRPGGGGLGREDVCLGGRLATARLLAARLWPAWEEGGRRGLTSVCGGRRREGREMMGVGGVTSEPLAHSCVVCDEPEAQTVC